MRASTLSDGARGICRLDSAACGRARLDPRSAGRGPGQAVSEAWRVRGFCLTRADRAGLRCRHRPARGARATGRPLTRNPYGRRTLHPACRGKGLRTRELAAAAESQQLARRHGETFAQAAASWATAACLTLSRPVGGAARRGRHRPRRSLGGSRMTRRLAAACRRRLMPLLFAGRLLPLSEIIEQALPATLSAQSAHWLAAGRQASRQIQRRIQLAGAGCEHRRAPSRPPNPRLPV